MVPHAARDPQGRGIAVTAQPAPAEAQGVVLHLGQGPARTGLALELLHQRLLPLGRVEVDPHLNGEVACPEVVDAVINRPYSVLGACQLVAVQVQGLSEQPAREAGALRQRQMTCTSRQVHPVAVKRPVANEIGRPGVDVVGLDLCV